VGGWVIPGQGMRGRASGRLAPLLINGTSRYQLLHLSCHPAPDGSLPAFAWGDVARMGGATPIRPITGRLSLPPPSFTRSPIGSPCGSLSPKGGLRAYHVPLVYPSGLGPSSTPGGLHLR
jgi:hypothetical protein